jgi:hypothetical protein
VERDEVEAEVRNSDAAGVDQVMAGFSRAWADFSLFATFQVRIFLYRPAIAGMQAGFSRFVRLREKFIDLGANWKIKLSIPAKIQ